MAKKSDPQVNIRNGLTVEELITLLSKYPGDTELVIETQDSMDGLSGGFYFSKAKTISLVGYETDIVVEEDDEDFDSIEAFGHAELVDETLIERDEHEDGDQAGPPFDPDPPAANEPTLPTKNLGEVDVPLRPASTGG